LQSSVDEELAHFKKQHAKYACTMPAKVFLKNVFSTAWNSCFNAELTVLELNHNGLGSSTAHFSMKFDDSL
ncbi:hypothetical protein T4B_5479, partial [Trichinella pseudospiralis]